jgi:serine O-acetyltransferase
LVVSLPEPLTELRAQDVGVSATDADWSRETKPFWSWDPSRSLLASIRAYRYASTPSLLGPILRNIAVVRHRFWSVVTGADIPINSEIGGGLLMPHPNGIVIHNDVCIGPNCLIFQQVTLGAHRNGTPTIGGHVDIGAGARIVGSITIGDHARIGMNAVVMIDVPTGARAVGVPARILDGA